MDTETALNLIDVDSNGDAEQRVGALFLAAEILQHGVPRPSVVKTEFPHELTAIAQFILHGTDIYNDTEEE